MAERVTDLIDCHTPFILGQGNHETPNLLNKILLGLLGIQIKYIEPTRGIAEHCKGIKETTKNLSCE